MVLGVIDVFVNIAESLFGGFISLPEILTNPIVSHLYVELFFIAVFVLVILISKFLTLKRLLFALLFSVIIGTLVGGVYFTVLAFIIQLPLVMVWKFLLFRKKDELGGEDLGDIDKELKMDTSKSDLGSIDEGLDLPKAEKMDESIPEITPEIPEVEDKSKKTCPYCGQTLTYYPQYQRYYCHTCKRYV